MKPKTLSDYFDAISEAYSKEKWVKAKNSCLRTLSKLGSLEHIPQDEFLLNWWLGQIYGGLSEYSRSLDFLYKADLIATTNHLHPVNNARTAFVIGYDLISMRNPNQALIHLQKVEKYYGQYGEKIPPMSRQKRFIILTYIGYCYLYNSNLPALKDIVEKKLPAYIDNNTEDKILRSYYHIKGEYLMLIKKYEEARKAFIESIKCNERSDYKRPILDLKLHIATLDLLEGRLDEAIKLLEASLKETRKLKSVSGANDLICANSLLLSKCYTLKGMPNKSALIEKRIKPILKELDITWLYERTREFEILYRNLQDLYQVGNKPIPLVLKNVVGKHHEKIAGKDMVIGETLEMKEIYQLVKRISLTDLPVLVEGETGTGKELIAKIIHQNSLRAENPWLAINCGAVPETLLESELFGYVKGAFTGASEDRKGYIELASEGTLFLDEVADMPPAMQQKLLRVFEDKKIWRLGSESPITINTRFVFATNKKLSELVEKKIFREDLFYRINTIIIPIPSLRERKEDIPILARYFMDKYSDNKKRLEISSKALDLILDYSWPGNIRELENEIKRICVLQSDAGLIEESMLSGHIRNYTSDKIPSLKDMSDLKELRKAFERSIIKEALKKCKGNITQSARLLGYDRSTLYDKIKQLNIALK